MQPSSPTSTSPLTGGNDTDSGTSDDDIFSSLSSRAGKSSDYPIRRLAIDLSLWINVIFLLTKVVADAMTLSLSVLAARTDSVLNVISQLGLNYTEKQPVPLLGSIPPEHPA